MKIRKIEITFPIEVNLSTQQLLDLENIIASVCNSNQPKGYTMWPAGFGSKIIYEAFTQEEEEQRDKEGKPPIEFDDSIYVINVAIKVL